MVLLGLKFRYFEEGCKTVDFKLENRVKLNENKKDF